MEIKLKPNLKLAQKVLPPPLYECLEYLFQKKIPDMALVGGTALAGFYFAHRRSDDLDLFTKTQDSQNATTLAVKSLSTLGVKFSHEFRSKDYYKATCAYKNHVFTIDIVLDPHLFEIGKFETLSNQMMIASLDTLFMTKAATLISRCSEKDLYDLFYLSHELKNITFKQIIEAGKKIDSGIHAESLLLSISGTKLNPTSCNFSLDPKTSAKEIYKCLQSFQKELIRSLRQILKDESAPPLKDLIQSIRKLK